MTLEERKLINKNKKLKQRDRCGICGCPCKQGKVMCSGCYDNMIYEDIQKLKLGKRKPINWKEFEISIN